MKRSHNNRYRYSNYKPLPRAALVVSAVLAAGAGKPCLADTPAEPASSLPIKLVTLFSSGVACTERAGMVSGNVSVPLVFHTGQINDILKSMVLVDSSGKVQPATYASKDPVARTLQGFAVDVSEDLTQVELLEKLRGAMLSVEVPGYAPIMGRLVGVEEKQATSGKDKPEESNTTFVTLLSDNRLVSLSIGPGVSIRIDDAHLNEELKNALITLAGSTDQERRQVTLHFAGNGRREVRVAYVMESPVWKMSYRLMMGGAKNGANSAPLLQGWAMVENTTDEDWKGVRLALVSGRPISFIQDLYQPLYIPRPEVGPDIVASPYPQTHDSNLFGDHDQRQAEKPLIPKPLGAAPLADIGGANRAKSPVQGGLRPNDIAANDLTAFSNNSTVLSLPATPKGMAGGEAMSSVAQAQLRAQATGARAGELFKYTISSPVTLPRRQAAMIPVINQAITADRVDIYNADDDGAFALNALRLHNATGLHLKGGPITLFDAGTYAGDARMEDVPPGDTRLVSYAVDLMVTGTRLYRPETTLKTTISVKHGVFSETQRVQQVTVYHLTSKAQAAKTVLIEHPISPGFSLVSPAKPAERTGEVYRFSVPLAAHTGADLKVVTEHVVGTRIAVSELGEDKLQYYFTNGSAPASLRAAFKEIIRRRAAIYDLKEQAKQRIDDISKIGDDQDRIRKNMEQLDRSSLLYRRYVSELGDQETHIQAHRQDGARLDYAAAAAQKSLEAFINNISD